MAPECAGTQAVAGACSQEERLASERLAEEANRPSRGTATTLAAVLWVSSRCQLISCARVSSLLSRRRSLLTRPTLLPACEELDPTLIAAASLSIDGQAGGQYIRNVHLESYSTPDEFHFSLYPSYAAALFPAALSFLRKTRADPTKTLVFVSAGFDASEHEYQGMSRHGRRVPTDFYRRFGRDVADFADAHAGGKLVAVLEGGYSLRALSTGVGSLRGSLCFSLSSRADIADVPA